MKIVQAALLMPKKNGNKKKYSGGVADACTSGRECASRHHLLKSHLFVIQ